MYLVDAASRGTGVNYFTQQRENNILGGDVIFQEDGGSISVENPSNGIYTLYITGPYAEDYLLDLSFTDQEKSVLLSFHGFNHADTALIHISVDSATDERIWVQGIPDPPVGLLANPQGTSSPTTRLSWTASSDSSVTGYRVYSKEKTTNYFTLEGAATTPSFSSTNPWSGASSVPVRVFAVSAVMSDGTESFFSNTTRNDDQDHDGLTDEQEVAFGSDKTKPDTDGDGLSDSQEYNSGTSPVMADTDGDGYSDYNEVQKGSDPLDPGSVPLATTATILWTSTTGTAVVYSMDGSGNLTYSVSYGPYTGWTAKCYHRNSGGTANMLWVNIDGTASVWAMDSGGNKTSSIHYGPYSGWTARSYYRNSDGTANMLWVNVDGTASVWAMDSGGNKTSSIHYGPYSGWTARSYYRNSDGTASMLWGNIDGTASVWSIDMYGNKASGIHYGPYTDLTALDINKVGY